MRKWAKPKIIIPIAIIFISLGLWAGFKVLGYLNYYYGKYLVPSGGTFYSCVPKELLVVTEDKFGHKFPDGITEIKTAKTLRSEGSVSFLIRFTAKPNVVDAFVNSFPEVKSFPEEVFREYTSSEDMRSSSLAWFNKPIRKGKICYPSMHGTARGFSFIHIDMTNEKWYVVYWCGSYY